MTRTTGVLLFDSGYTMKVSTARSPCFTVTHSPWRGDFSRAALAQSCPRARGAATEATASKLTRAGAERTVGRFMVWFSPSEKVAGWNDAPSAFWSEWDSNAYATGPQVGYVRAHLLMKRRLDRGSEPARS